MSDQAQKLRAKVNETKLSNLIDDIKNIKDVSEIYHRLAAQSGNSCAVICFASSKGGVGKTMCLYSFAEALKACGKRVAVIDMNKCYSDISLYYANPEIIVINRKNLLDNVCFSGGEQNNEEQRIYHLSGEIRSVEYQLIKIILYQSKLSDFDYALIDTPVCGAELLENIYPIIDRLIITSTQAFNSLYNATGLLQNSAKQLDEEIEFDFFVNYFDESRNALIEQFAASVDEMEKVKLNSILKLRNDKLLELLDRQNASPALRAEQIKKSALYSQIKKFIEFELFGMREIAGLTDKKKFVDKIFGFLK